MRTAVFLRAVNLGATNKISMPALRGALEKAGYTGVQTVVQSGNVVADKITAAGMVKVIKSEFGLDIQVITRTHAELKAVVAGNPFKEHEQHGSKLNVAFLDRAPASFSIDRDAYLPDEFELRGKEIYLWYPNGLGRSKLLNDSAARKTGIAATVRNWNTVLKMLALTE
jgi:uncharacterized protein (DUF1697 family)